MDCVSNHVKGTSRHGTKTIFLLSVNTCKGNSAWNIVKCPMNGGGCSRCYCHPAPYCLGPLLSFPAAASEFLCKSVGSHLQCWASLVHLPKGLLRHLRSLFTSWQGSPEMLGHIKAQENPQPIRSGTWHISTPASRFLGGTILRHVLQDSSECLQKNQAPIAHSRSSFIKAPFSYLLPPYLTFSTLSIVFPGMTSQINRLNLNPFSESTFLSNQS